MQGDAIAFGIDDQGAITVRARSAVGFQHFPAAGYNCSYRVIERLQLK